MNLRMEELFHQPASFIYLNLCYKMNSRGKPKLALMIFLLFFPCRLLFIKLLWIHLSKAFFWLTVYYIFISLEMGAAGSLINESKSCFCQIQTNNPPPIAISPLVLAFLKQALFPSAVFLGVSAKVCLHPAMPRAEVRHWVMSRTQPAALESKGSCSMIEGETDSPG